MRSSSAGSLPGMLATLPDEWAIATGLTPATVRRYRAAGIDVREDHDLRIFGGRPTGVHILTWCSPRPDVLDPSLLEPHFPRPIFG
jgi:hypothetical protein